MKKIPYISKYGPPAAADGSALPTPIAPALGAAPDASPSAAQNYKSKIKIEQKRLSSRAADKRDEESNGKATSETVHHEPLSGRIDYDHRDPLNPPRSTDSHVDIRAYPVSLTLNRQRVLLEVEQAIHDLIHEENRDRDFFRQQEFAERSYLSRTMFIEIVQFEAVERTADHHFSARFQTWYRDFMHQKDEITRVTREESTERNGIEQIEREQRREYVAAALTRSLAHQLKERSSEQQRLDVLAEKAQAAFDAEARVVALKKRERLHPFPAVEMFQAAVEVVKPQSGSVAVPLGSSWTASREVVHFEEIVYRRTIHLEREAFVADLEMEREEYVARGRLLTLFLVGSHPLKLAALITIQRWWRSLQYFRKDVCGSIWASRRQQLCDALQKVRAHGTTSEALKRRMLRLQRAASNTTSIGSREVFASACMAMERSLNGSVHAILMASATYRLGALADAYDREAITQFLASQGNPIALRVLSHSSASEQVTSIADSPHPTHRKGSGTKSYADLLMWDGPHLEEGLSCILKKPYVPGEYKHESGGVLNDGAGAAQRLLHLESEYADTFLGDSSSARWRWYHASPHYVKSLAELEAAESRQRSLIKKRYVKFISQSKLLRSLACNDRNQLYWMDLCAKCNTVSAEEEVSRTLLACEEAEVRELMNESVKRIQLVQTEREQRHRLQRVQRSQEEQFRRTAIINDEEAEFGELGSEEWMWNNLAAIRRVQTMRGKKTMKGPGFVFSGAHSRQSASKLTSLTSASLVIERFAQKVLRVLRRNAQLARRSRDLAESGYAEMEQQKQLRGLRGIALQNLKAVQEDCADNVILPESLARSLGLSKSNIYGGASWMSPSAAMKYKSVVRRFHASNKRELAEMRALFAVAAKGRSRIARDEEAARETFEIQSKNWRTICRFEMIQDELTTRTQIEVMENVARAELRETRNVHIEISSQILSAGVKHPRNACATHAPRPFLTEPLPVVRFAQKAQGRGPRTTRHAAVDVLCSREAVGRWELQRQRTLELAELVQRQCHEQRELLLSAARSGLPFLEPCRTFDIAHVERRQQKKKSDTTTTSASASASSASVPLGSAFLLYWEESECRRSVEWSHATSFSSPLLRGYDDFATAVLIPGHVQYLAGMSREVLHLERQLTASLCHRVGRISAKLDDLVNLETDLRGKLGALEEVSRSRVYVRFPKKRSYY